MEDMETRYENKTIFLLLTVICFMGLLLCFRSQYGVDFTDESHYLALAKRFSQGDRPFREEWFPAQVIGILLLPFFNIYSRITGGTDGIILAARIVFVIFHVIFHLPLLQSPAFLNNIPLPRKCLPKPQHTPRC